MLRLGDVAFLSGTLGFLSVALLLLVPQMSNKPQFTNLDVACWAPKHFTPSAVVYTQKICKASLFNNQSYRPFTDVIPCEGCPEHDYFSIYDELAGFESSNRSVLVLVVFEVLFIFAFYSLFLIGHQGDSALCRIASTVGHVVGILFFLLAAFIPYSSLTNVLDPLPNVAQEKIGKFMCEFKIRHLGYAPILVQCTYSMSVSAPHITNEGNVEPYLNLNSIICGAVVVAIIGSFTSTLILRKDQSSKN